MLGDKVFLMWSLVVTMPTLAFFLLWRHLDRWRADTGKNVVENIAAGLSISSAGASLITLAIERMPILFPTMAAMLLLFGSGLFVFMSNVLISGLARRLTKRRGENWTKEMEYIYLAIGSVGVLGTIGRIQFVSTKVESIDAVAPIFLTVAIVIRFLKTRAEIGGWNKPSF